MRSKFIVLTSLFVLFQIASVLTAAAESTVLRVVVIQTDKVDEYVKEIERGKGIFQRLQSTGKIRMWRARFAGPNAGTVVVSVEYPSLSALAADDAKTASDQEFQTWLKGLDKIRKIVSDSLYTEMNP